MSRNQSFWRGIVNKSGDPLDTGDRINEILFGLIMVLTFTCSISVATEGREEIGTILWGALGCNVAWGLIDGLFFLMGTIFSRGEGLQTVSAVRKASDEEATKIVKDAMNPLLASIAKEEHIAYFRDEIKKLPEPPKAFFTWSDIKGFFIIFFLVVITTFPPVIPFIFLKDAAVALRVSNAIALVLLFIAGFILGKKTGWRPVLMGGMSMLVGAVLVAITIALGG